MEHKPIWKLLVYLSTELGNELEELIDQASHCFLSSQHEKEYPMDSIMKTMTKGMKIIKLGEPIENTLWSRTRIKYDVFECDSIMSLSVLNRVVEIGINRKKMVILAGYLKNKNDGCLLASLPEDIFKVIYADMTRVLLDEIHASIDAFSIKCKGA
jgi:hypothetical protein